MVEKKLPDNTTINGYPYQLVQRDDYRAIYQQTILEEKPGRPARYHWEVFRIRVSCPKVALATLYAKKGKSTDHLPDRSESFPGEEDFGSTAWSCFTLEEALKKFEAIQPRHAVRSITQD